MPRPLSGNIRAQNNNNKRSLPQANKKKKIKKKIAREFRGRVARMSRLWKHALTLTLYAGEIMSHANFTVRNRAWMSRLWYYSRRWRIVVQNRVFGDRSHSFDKCNDVQAYSKVQVHPWCNREHYERSGWRLATCKLTWSATCTSCSRFVFTRLTRFKMFVATWSACRKVHRAKQ